MKHWIIPISLLILFEAIADVFAKEYSERKILWWGVAAIFWYIVCNVFWLFALKGGVGLAKGSLIFSVASALIGSGIGVLVYRETLGMMQGVGIFLGIISLVFLLWE